MRTRPTLDQKIFPLAGLTILLFLLGACSSTKPVATIPDRPIVVKKVEALSTENRAAPKTQTSVDVSTTLTSGEVEFREFSEDALVDFLVIPENGKDLFQPGNGQHRSVDGFWWRPTREWYKIPNHCRVVVTATPEPGRPSAFRARAHCSQVGILLQQLWGRASVPGFYPDRGGTKHGTDYPFAPQ